MTFQSQSGFFAEDQLVVVVGRDNAMIFRVVVLHPLGTCLFLVHGDVVAYQALPTLPGGGSLPSSSSTRFTGLTCWYMGALNCQIRLLYLTAITDYTNQQILGNKAIPRSSSYYGLLLVVRLIAVGYAYIVAAR